MLTRQRYLYTDSLDNFILTVIKSNSNNFYTIKCEIPLNNDPTMYSGYCDDSWSGEIGNWTLLLGQEEPE